MENSVCVIHLENIKSLINKNRMEFWRCESERASEKGQKRRGDVFNEDTKKKFCANSLCSSREKM